MKKWGGGDLGEETKLEEGLRVKWGKGKGGGGYFQTHLLQDMKTDITGASDGVLVSLTSVPISIEISPTFTASLKNRLFLAFFISVCVCFSWFGPVFNFTTHLRIKKKKIREGKEFPKSSSESVGIFFSIECPSECNNIFNVLCH